MKEIKLTKNKVAIVDDEDYNYLNQWKWYASKYKNIWYAQRSDYSSGKKKTIKMHRVIMKSPVNMVIDHEDRNGLNNQKNNLSVCTFLENMDRGLIRTNKKVKNKGIYKEDNKWVVKLTIHVGRFDKEEDAITALNCAKQKLNIG